MPRKSSKQQPTTGVVEVNTIVTMVPLELIDDNPYNVRQVYTIEDIKAMSMSIQTYGLLQPPAGRKTMDGRVQLAFGHLRKRGFQDAHTSPDGELEPSIFPVRLKDLTDMEMFDFAMAENLQRVEVKPIGVARAILKFSQAFPDVLDKEIARKHNMSESNVSNMKRVLRLPQPILDKVDAGTLSFTQGRELLAFEGLPEPEKLMTEAVGLVEHGDFPNTVDGLKSAIRVIGYTVPEAEATGVVKKEEPPDSMPAEAVEPVEQTEPKSQRNLDDALAERGLLPPLDSADQKDTKMAANARKKEAESRKKTEDMAIHEAILMAPIRERGLIQLVIYSILEGVSKSIPSSNIESPSDWFWEKVSPSTPWGKRTTVLLMEKVDKMLDFPAQQKLVAEFIFYSIQDHNEDVSNHKVQTTYPLMLMGIDLEAMLNMAGAG